MSRELIGQYNNFAVFRFSSDVRLRNFQYKILNGLCYMNNDLFRMKISNSDKCTFCGKGLETVEHLFMNVNTVKQSGLQPKTG